MSRPSFSSLSLRPSEFRWIVQLVRSSTRLEEEVEYGKGHVEYGTGHVEGFSLVVR